MPFWGLGWLSASSRHVQGPPESKSVPASSRTKKDHNVSPYDLQTNLEKRVHSVRDGRVKKRHSSSPGPSRRMSAIRQQHDGRTTLIPSIERDEEAVASNEGGEDTPSRKQIKADSNPLGLDADEKRDVMADCIIEAGPHLDRDDPANADWTTAEADLFDLLQDCGAEPMLPMSWKLDFPVLPDACFTTEDDLVVIGAQNGKDHHGSRALKELFQVGPRVRDRTLQGASPTRLLQQAINRYIKWAMSDGGLEDKQFDPVLCVKVAKNDHVERAVEVTNNEMGRMRERYRAVSGGPRPVIFGIVIVKAVMTFVALDTQKDTTEPKAIALYDWNLEGQDAWSAMAVAVLAMLTRATLQGMDLKKRSKRKEVNDPDA